VLVQRTVMPSNTRGMCTSRSLHHWATVIVTPSNTDLCNSTAPQFLPKNFGSLEFIQNPHSRTEPILLIDNNSAGTCAGDSEVFPGAPSYPCLTSQPPLAALPGSDGSAQGAGDDGVELQGRGGAIDPTALGAAEPPGVFWGPLCGHAVPPYGSCCSSMQVGRFGGFGVDALPVWHSCNLNSHASGTTSPRSLPRSLASRQLKMAFHNFPATLLEMKTLQEVYVTRFATHMFGPRRPLQVATTA